MTRILTIDKLKMENAELKRHISDMEAERKPSSKVLDEIRKLQNIKHELKEEIEILQSNLNILAQTNTMVPIEGLQLTPRLRSFLENNNIVYVNPYYCMQMQELKTVRNLGKKGITAIRMAIVNYFKNREN